MSVDSAYEYIGLSVRDGTLLPDRPVQLPETCLGNLLDMLIGDGWELDPEWHPSDPELTLRRSTGETIHAGHLGSPSTP